MTIDDDQEIGPLEAFIGSADSRAAHPAGRGWPRRSDDWIRLPAAFGDVTVNRRRVSGVDVRMGERDRHLVRIIGDLIDADAILPTLEEAQTLRAEVVRLLTEGDPS